MLERLEGAHNFRSLRGLRMGDGRRIAGHTLLRSDHLGRLTPADWQRLQQLGLKTICDLRGANERRHLPNSVPAGVIRELHFDMTADVRLNPQYLAAARTPGEGSELQRAEAMMLAIYQSLPDALAPHLRALFQLLEQGEAPVLVHCTVGKDRTGFVMAVLLHALGATQDDIVTEYLRTLDSPLLADPARKAGVKRALVHAVGACSDEMLDVILDVRPAFLQAALARVVAGWGSLDGYLHQEAGFDRERLLRLRDRYLAP
jgi:protein-tyrosine phosphatase